MSDPHWVVVGGKIVRVEFGLVKDFLRQMNNNKSSSHQVDNASSTMGKPTNMYWAENDNAGRRIASIAREIRQTYYRSNKRSDGSCVPPKQTVHIAQEASISAPLRQEINQNRRT